MLARLRFPVESSRGRRCPEPEHPYRNAFQRDRDRLVHSRAFRRLEAKTQVFAPRLSDHFRNRLTHTIEVAQMARTVAGALQLDTDLTEALALAHDIGHPPFGHAGEAALNTQMARFGDGFDHNLHALHIVETFEQRYARFTGLNLTFEVREGMVKHSRDFVLGERAEFDPYLPGLRPPLEAQLIDLADEVAYNTADLDDVFTAGLLTADDVAAAIPPYATLYDSVAAEFPGASLSQLFQEALRRLIDMLVSALIEGTQAAAREAGVEDVDAVRIFPGRLAHFTPPAATLSRELKIFLHARVYSIPALVEHRRRSKQRIGELFQCFLEYPERLPAGYRQRLLNEPAHRVVCDYLAGMTDAFFERTYEQTMGVPPTPPPV